MGVCVYCAHGAHEAGDCNSCNCGESEIVRSGYSADITPLWVYEDRFWFQGRLSLLMIGANFNPDEHGGSIEGEKLRSSNHEQRR